MGTITSLKNYIENNNINYKDFAFQLGIKEKTLNKYINGEYPPKNIMERIVVYTEGEVQPIDFLFHYKKDFSIIEYIQQNIKLGKVTLKELAWELNINRSNIHRRLQGKYRFKKEEIKKIIYFIDKKKEDK